MPANPDGSYTLEPGETLVCTLPPGTYRQQEILSKAMDNQLVTTFFRVSSRRRRYLPLFTVKEDDQ